MKRHIVPVLIIIMVAALGFSETAYKFEEKEQIQKILKFQDPAKPKALQLDNVFSGIDVQGYDGSQVELVAHKTIKAKSQDKLQKAKEEVKMKTFNGEAFSDFEVKALPASAEVKESQNTNKTKFVYKRDRFTQIRIGKGGPAIECDTLNGDILIKKSH